MTVKVYHFTHPMQTSATWTEHHNVDSYEIKDNFLYIYRRNPETPIIYNMKTVTNITPL